MSVNVFQDMPLSDAQIQQDYSLQAIKNVNDASVARFVPLEAGLPVGPSAGDNAPAQLADLNRRFIVNIGGADYYIYGADIPAPYNIKYIFGLYVKI